MLNQSIWMLPYEVDLYVGFALVATLGRRARIAVAAGLVALALGAVPPMAAEGGVLECWSLSFAGFFAFGVLLREWPALRGDAFIATCVACGVVALACGARSVGLLLVIPTAAIWIGLRSWPSSSRSSSRR